MSTLCLIHKMKNCPEQMKSVKRRYCLLIKLRTDNVRKGRVSLYFCISVLHLLVNLYDYGLKQT